MVHLIGRQQGARLSVWVPANEKTKRFRLWSLAASWTIGVFVLRIRFDQGKLQLFFSQQILRV